MQALALNTIVLHNDARAANNLTGVSLLVDLAQAGPGAEDLGISNLDEVDLVLRTKRLNELEVFSLRHRLDEHTKMGLALVKSLGTLAKATGQRVMQKRVLQYLLQIKSQRKVHRKQTMMTNLKCLFDSHLALGRVRHLNGGILNLNIVISSVRHPISNSNQRMHPWLMLLPTLLVFSLVKRVVFEREVFVRYRRCEESKVGWAPVLRIPLICTVYTISHGWRAPIWSEAKSGKRPGLLIDAT